MGPASRNLSLSVLQIHPHGSSNCSAGGKLRHRESLAKINQCCVRLGCTQPALLLQGMVMVTQPGGTRGLHLRTDQREAAKAAPKVTLLQAPAEQPHGPHPPQPGVQLTPLHQLSPSHGDSTNPMQQLVTPSSLKHVWALSKDCKSLSQSS